MDETTLFLTITGMTLVTCGPRILPVLALASRPLPAPVVRWLSFVPAAVLSAMLAPALLVHDGAIALNTDNYYLWAAIPAFLVAWKTRSFFGTVALGMALVAGARHFFG